MVQVYKEPLCRRYYGSILGEALLLRVFAYLGAIALALVVAYATGGFWIKLKPDNVQASVHYTYDALLIFEGLNPGEVMVWSSLSTINTQFSNYVTAATVQAGEEDINNDGKVDIISFSAAVAKDFPIHSVKALLQFHYSISGTLKLDMYSLAYLQHSSPVQGAALFTDGHLELVALTQLPANRYSSVYNTPLLNSTTPLVQSVVQPTVQLELQSILQGYLSRNYTTSYQNYNPVWMSGIRDSFTLNMRIRIPPHQVVYYRPAPIEMLKGGWIQWLATFVALWYLLTWAEWFVFTQRLVETRVVSDFKPKMQKF